MLTKDMYWEIIKQCRTTVGNDMNRYFQAAEQRIARLSKHDQGLFATYTQHYAQFAQCAMTDMMCLVLNKEIDDDTSYYFNLWLIAQGKDFYLTALRDPDILTDYVPASSDHYQFEQMSTLGTREISANTHITDGMIDELVDEISYYRHTPYANFQSFKDLREAIPRLLPKMSKRFNFNLIKPNSPQLARTGEPEATINQETNVMPPLEPMVKELEKQETIDKPNLETSEIQEIIVNTDSETIEIIMVDDIKNQPVETIAAHSLHEPNHNHMAEGNTVKQSKNKMTTDIWLESRLNYTLPIIRGGIQSVSSVLIDHKYMLFNNICLRQTRNVSSLNLYNLRSDESRVIYKDDRSMFLKYAGASPTHHYVCGTPTATEAGMEQEKFLTVLTISAQTFDVEETYEIKLDRLAFMEEGCFFDDALFISLREMSAVGNEQSYNIYRYDLLTQSFELHLDHAIKPKIKKYSFMALKQNNEGSYDLVTRDKYATVFKPFVTNVEHYENTDSGIVYVQHLNKQRTLYLADGLTPKPLFTVPEEYIIDHVVTSKNQVIFDIYTQDHGEMYKTIIDLAKDKTKTIESTSYLSIFDPEGFTLIDDGYFYAGYRNFAMNYRFEVARWDLTNLH